MLMKNSADSKVGEDSLGPKDNIVFLNLKTLAKQQMYQNQGLLIRCVLVYVELLVFLT